MLGIEVVFQVVLALESKAAVVAHEWSLDLMHLGMALEAGHTDEFLEAEITAEWLVLVDSLVSLQAPNYLEAFCTNLALEREFGGMQLSMRAHILLGFEAFVAVRALEFVFLAVYRQMALAVLFLDETFVADMALPRTAAGMQVLMAFQAVLRA